jgi:uncharacterized protein (TIGR00369 family)
MPATTEAAANISDRNGHSSCLLCGRQNPRSLSLVFRAGEGGAVRAQFKGSPEFQGYDGILHGGVVASLLDAAMTHCLFHRGIQAVTGDLQIRYIKPVPFDAVLDIQASVISSKTPLHYLQAEIIHNGCIMAWAKAKFMQRRIER